MAHSNTPQLGLKENWKQFSLLVLVNAFVGGMVGLERTILPNLAESEFGLTAHAAVLSFIVVFGISKAITNYFAGALANRFGRRKLLIAGWLFAIPVPFVLIYADSWSAIVASNALLGINQGLAWSSTVVMKIDLVGPKNRGFAMGINESAGYLSVGLIALLTGFLAEQYDLRPYPFYIGILLSILGLLTSIFFIKDTVHHANAEQETSALPKLKNVFLETSLTNKNLGSISFAGLVNNLNDGMIWGLLPVILLQADFSLKDISFLVAIYPTVWGLSQLVTGKLADRYAKKQLLWMGMLAQGIVILGLNQADTFNQFVAISIILGLGTAVVYPTFLAAIADFTTPSQRAESIGVFRLWRDLGYAIGAILTGLVADTFGLSASVWMIGLLTISSAGVIGFRMESGK